MVSSVEAINLPVIAKGFRALKPPKSFFNTLLESVLQVICRRHCFQFSEGATLGQLLDVVVPGLGLEQVYSEKLKLMATIRNRLSSSHGGGTEPRNPERHYAQLMLTMTAAAIVFLVQASNSK